MDWKDLRKCEFRLNFTSSLLTDYIGHLYTSLGRIQMASKSSIFLRQAATLALSDYKLPTLTAYRLGVMLFDLYLAGEIHGKKIDVRNPLPERRHYTQVLQFLLSYGVLNSMRGFPSGAVYTLIGRSEPTAPELICAVDPFAYLSHLSAMAIHGLTDRIPHTLFVSSPSPQQWRSAANAQMSKDLGDRLKDYLDAGFPPLLRTRFDKVLGQPVQLTQSSHLGAFKKLEPNGVKVSTIGRTFLDMLREADLCGGIQHVLDVYKQHAKSYLPLIVGEIDQHGTDIDKVRAGYVLEELCGLQIETFTAWVKAAKRGGSRKLVPQNPYSSTFSKKWCLSLNAD